MVSLARPNRSRNERPHYEYASHRSGVREGQAIPAATRLASMPPVQDWHSRTPPWMDEGEADPVVAVSPLGETQNSGPAERALQPQPYPRLILRRFRDVNFVDDDEMPRWFGPPVRCPLLPKRQALFVFAS